MECCEKDEPIIMNLLLESKSQKKKKKIEIDLFKVDKDNSNILHYLFNQPKETDVEINFEKNNELLFNKE